MTVRRGFEFHYPYWHCEGLITMSTTTIGRVLVVEDHESERRAVSQILKAEGFTVYGAENADKAIGYIEENIDVVLSDLQMGDVSGLDLLNLWKKRRPETHFIVLTGHSSVNSAVE